LDYIATPVTTVVASVPASSDEGYKAALDAIMASNVQPNITNFKVELDEETLYIEAADVKTELITPQVRRELEFELIGFDEQGTQQYRCCLCNVYCTDPALHQAAHIDDKPFVCYHQDCGKSYKTPTALKQHFRTNHTKPLSHNCMKCGKEFKSEYLMKKHMTITCNDSRPFSCRECGKSFKTVAKLKYHEGTHAEIKPYECSVCQKPMATKAHLKVHMAVHNEGNFACFCGKHFKSAKRYQEHYKLIHDPNNPYRCDICHRNFKNLETLEHHKGSHNRPFSCRICKKGFVQVLSCRMHERIKHKLDIPQEITSEGIDTNVCPICSKSFKSNHSMEVHLTVHMLDDIFPCPHCDKKFKLQKHLLSHMIVHQDKTMPCPKCNKKFKHERHLKIHLNSHDKPFECKTCGARFSNERYLNVHSYRHESGAPLKRYRCPKCEKTFPSLSNAKLHLDHFHPDTPASKILRETPLKQLSLPRQRKKGRVSSQGRKVEGNFNCEACGDLFESEHLLITHEMKKHAESQRISCTECEVKFITARTLKVHLFNEHDIGTVIFCEHCEREFYDEGDLDNHVQIVHKIQLENQGDAKQHKQNVLKNRVYPCVLCLKHFPSRSLLSLHEKEYHVDSDYLCRLCNLAFENVSDLKKHCQDCSATKCFYCCQECNSKDALKSHLALHQIGNVVFKCSVCNMDFKNVEELKIHKESHSMLSNIENNVSPERGFKSLLSNFVK
jgi:KRAB domain-containing zinc finger protein